MILEAFNISKSIGPKDLFYNLSFTIHDGEKIALIGRNGQGKTTLLRMLAGEDSDFLGEIKTRKQTRIILTKQEHLEEADKSALTYILESVPGYYRAQQIMQDFEQGALSDITAYSKALDLFMEKGYFHISEKIIHTLFQFQISESQAHESFSLLSGGEKRYVELTRLMYSDADIYLIDEPTNHMDYLGKEQFISWLISTQKSMIVVTHDRDVLHAVDAIYEMKDKKLTIYRGNYDNYRLQNTNQTISSVKLYQDQLNRLKDAKKRMEWGRRMRAKSKEWKIRFDHWQRDYEKLNAETVKPSFWIDQESTENLDSTITDSYHKYKEKNIAIGMHQHKERIHSLLTVRDLTLAYKVPIFKQLSFTVRGSDRVFIKGKNGAGKSTLVRTIMSLYRDQPPSATVESGRIDLGSKLKIGEYEQEINKHYLPLTLEDAIRDVYLQLNTPISDTELRSLLAQYLFDPIIEGKQIISQLSGGQKARFQLIKMLAQKPNLLILDEPTNHLDLPSIEELEKALFAFEGGILYISHDSYFINTIGGVVVELL